MKSVKRLVILVLALCLTVSFSIVSFGGEWKQTEIGWQYQNDDNSYPISQWQWIDDDNDGLSECYYFDENGYLLVNTVTPDNYEVNENGAWIVNGNIQTQQAISSQYSINPTIFEEMNMTVRNLAAKYGGFDFDQSVSYLEPSGDRLYFKNQPTFKNYGGSYKKVEGIHYLPEYDKNNDGVVDLEDCNFMTVEELMTCGEALDDKWYLELDKRTLWIDGSGMLVGFDKEYYAVEELADILKGIGATNIRVKNHNYQEEIIDGGVTKDGAITFIPTGRYVTRNTTSIYFDYNGLTFYSGGIKGNIYINTEWHVTHAD